MIKSPIDTVFYNIEKSIKLYRRMAHKRLKKSNLQITIDQVLVLWLIEKEEKTSQTEIAELLFKDIASITRIIELLVNKGYLNRGLNKTDRRHYLLNVTKKGKKILEESFTIVQENRTTALEGITASDIDTLNKVLLKIINNCQTK